MSPHKIRQEWLTLDEAAEVIRQHNITLLPRRPDPPCPARRSVALGLLPFARSAETTQSSLPLCLPIQQASLSAFAVQQTRQPQDNGELSAMQTRPDSATDHQPSVEFAVNRLERSAAPPATGENVESPLSQRYPLLHQIGIVVCDEKRQLLPTLLPQIVAGAFTGTARPRKTTFRKNYIC
ncbi:Uncharacterised protein [Klebsiella pneumoniae]|uniref:Uncharacterized protein n=1 Tax=Klebsiella pneumoniae TaxID=573 RepID=A0A2X3FQK8_KLEPN|nr:Uncharacterised protein [Klebsiella pneumoniae]